jgi:hypothetical protein
VRMAAVDTGGNPYLPRTDREIELCVPRLRGRSPGERCRLSRAGYGDARSLSRASVLSFRGNSDHPEGEGLGDRMADLMPGSEPSNVMSGADGNACVPALRGSREIDAGAITFDPTAKPRAWPDSRTLGLGTKTFRNGPFPLCVCASCGPSRRPRSVAGGGCPKRGSYDRRRRSTGRTRRPACVVTEPHPLVQRV